MDCSKLPVLTLMLVGFDGMLINVSRVYMAEAFTDAGYNIAEIHSNLQEARNIRNVTLDEIKQYPAIMDLFIEASELNNYDISVILKQLGFKESFISIILQRCRIDLTSL